MHEKTTTKPPAPPGRQGRFDLGQRLLDFGCLMIDIVDSMSQSRAGSHVAGQLIRSGTSPLANHAEAKAAESRADFVHKLGVVLKELRETLSWLRVVDRKKLAGRMDLVTIAIPETEELIRIFWTSINTAEANARTTRRKLPAPARACGSSLES